MNTTRTDHEALILDHTVEYRQRLIESQRRANERGYISFDNSWLDEPISLWKALGLVLFVMAMVAGIARLL